MTVEVPAASLAAGKAYSEASLESIQQNGALEIVARQLDKANWRGLA
ncbi:hypothetical protein [Rhizobium leguminosarum]|jgi:hypothetical protein|uniref:Uncharacterized protein n=1 Tax=Rhizobium leguminosarum TaxID=384 RepID=A0A6P0BA96_RHILE|nr:hypothetical protein [Rhizobium leguminosarum]MBY5440698.1 hypothetical protein [Rhizobium leguminosarum]NEI36368.1 hypothetical protein [Rhizobium leguminosarum]NEI42635.1 hypothetical protein [Rhizobium leguminosarum]